MSEIVETLLDIYLLTYFENSGFQYNGHLNHKELQKWEKKQHLFQKMLCLAKSHSWFWVISKRFDLVMQMSPNVYATVFFTWVMDLCSSSWVIMGDHGSSLINALLVSRVAFLLLHPALFVGQCHKIKFTLKSVVNKMWKLFIVHSNNRLDFLSNNHQCFFSFSVIIKPVVSPGHFILSPRQFGQQQ